MEKLLHPYLAVVALCLLCCGLSNASPTLIPPMPSGQEDSMKDGGPGLSYLFTMPQTLQAGAEEKYCLTLQGVTTDITLTLELLGLENGHMQDYSHTYSNGEGQCNSFQVPDVPGRYEVNLQRDGETFATSQVQVLGNNLITFVQTDKPIYKPGQKVKFRILTMMRDLRSRVGEIESVFIKDPNDFKVKQYKNVASKGMANLEFQLINDAKLGTWNIEVMIDGETTKQEFKVLEYVLPRFEVTVTPPPYFLVTSETFNGSVCAKYTYGKKVKGFMTLQVCPSGYGTFGQSCAIVQAEIDGCHEFSISSSELMSTGDRYFYGRSFSLQASVREMDTGVQVNGTATGPEISHDPLKMEFSDDTNGYFKPGLPIHGKLKVSKPDGEPAVDEPILITARDHNNNIYLEKLFHTNDMGQIDYSICQGLKDNTATLSMFAEAQNYKNDDHEGRQRRLYTPTTYGSFRQWFSPSLSYIQIPAHTNTVKCEETLNLMVPFTHDGTNHNVKFHYQVMSRGRIIHTGTTTATSMSRPQYLVEPVAENCLEVAEEPTHPPPPVVTDAPTPSLPEDTDSEIAPTPPVLVGEPVFHESRTITRPRMQPDPEPERVLPPYVVEEVDTAEEVRRKRSIMPYPGTGMGEEEKIVRSDSLSDQVSSVQIRIPIVPDMSPSFNLLLYYVRDDGETVADSMEFKVEPCFENQVKMEFADETVMPGAETSIHLEAAAGSVCGIGVVDKSVNILGGDHQITPKKVFEKLKDYSLSQRYSYSYYRSDNKYCQEKMVKKEIEKAQEEEEVGDDEPDESAEEEPYYADYWYRSNYVDAITAFKQMGMLVITNLVLETRPCSKNVPVYYGLSFQPGSGPLQAVGLPAPPGGPLRRRPPSATASPSPVVDVRSDFPETWLWDLHTVGETGSMDIPHTVPHTITQWRGNSLCINDVAGFGLSPVTSITTFQPFFLSINLPYNAVRGERLPITVTVYNYLDKCLHMVLALDGMKGFKVHGHRANTRPFCVCGGKSETKKFYITAMDIGKLPIFAQAEVVPGQCTNSLEVDTQYLGLTDAVERKVLVKAEGVTQRYTDSAFICPADVTQESQKDFNLPLPPDMVKGSSRGAVTVIGDIMGPALSNLDGLVRMPTGCGEQNMVGFTPNIYVLKYLTASGKLTEEIETKTKHHMEIGYQRELKYRHLDGSFSAYGKSDKPGSTWLTAFVVKSFAQARPYVFIDEDDLQLSMNYLIRVQNPEDGPLEGCFFERGQVFSSYLKGGMGKESNDAVLSAFVLIALLEAGLDRQDAVTVSAIECINRQLHLDPELDPYTLSVVAYANTLYDPTGRETADIMARLNDKAVVDGEVKYWKRQGEQPPPVNSWYYYSAPSAEVEMTSYAMLATLNFYPNNSVPMSQPVASWLSRQQGPFGGFSSTQDTVMGLNALSEFAARTYSDEPTDLEVTMQTAGDNKVFMINDENSLLLQRHPLDISGDGTVVRARVTGTGCALIQASVSYNKLPSKLGISDPQFNLRVDPRQYQHDRNQCARRTVHITYGQKNTGQYSNGMTMLTVRMVTGWSVIPESLRELKSRFSMLGIERYELNEEEGVINFYLDQLDTRTRRFALDMEQDTNMLVVSPKPAEVQIYQYYEKDVTVIVSYKLRTTCGTKEEIPYDQPIDNVDDGIIEQRRVATVGAPRSNVLRTTDRRDSEPGISRRPSRTRIQNCPICHTDKAPRDYDRIICNSTAVYKAHSGRPRKYSLKIKANLRPRRKQRNINLFANFTMAEDCVCSLLKPPMKTVLIVTKATNLQGKMLTVDGQTHIFNLKKDRSLEKKARKAQRRCRLN